MSAGVIRCALAWRHIPSVAHILRVPRPCSQWDRMPRPLPPHSPVRLAGSRRRHGYLCDRAHKGSHARPLWTHYSPVRLEGARRRDNYRQIAPGHAGCRVKETVQVSIIETTATLLSPHSTAHTDDHVNPLSARRWASEGFLPSIMRFHTKARKFRRAPWQSSFPLRSNFSRSPSNAAFR
jgi:hypothetical protein